jgi:hypothetical protein
MPAVLTPAGKWTDVELADHATLGDLADAAAGGALIDQVFALKVNGEVYFRELPVTELPDGAVLEVVDVTGVKSNVPDVELDDHNPTTDDADEAVELDEQTGTLD